MDREIFHFPCSADHEQDWQPHPVDPVLATVPYFGLACDHGNSFLALKSKKEKGTG